MFFLQSDCSLATLLAESSKSVPVQTADKLVCYCDRDRAWGFEKSYSHVIQGGLDVL